MTNNLKVLLGGSNRYISCTEGYYYDFKRLLVLVLVCGLARFGGFHIFFAIIFCSQTSIAVPEELLVDSLHLGWNQYYYINVVYHTYP